MNVLPKPAMAARGVLVVADDLSGAAESAARMMMRDTRTRIVLRPAASSRDGAGERAARPRDERDSADVLVVDTDTRHRPPAEAAGAVRAALAMAGAGRPRLVFKKIDSLLRGNVAAEVAALATPGTGVVVTPALPGLDRVVRGGVLHLAGVPLHRTGAWAVEGVPAPGSVGAALAPHPARVLDLATVRSNRLAEAVASCAAHGRIAVCDAETDRDLDAVLCAALTLPAVRLAGSGGLADALGRHLRATGSTGEGPGDGERAPVRVRRDAALLVVVGSAEPAAAEQARRLAHAGAERVALPLSALLHPDRAPLPAIPIGDRPVVVVLDSAGALLPAASRVIARRLAEVVADAARAAGRPVSLVLTGGETARRVLDALHVRELTPLGQVHPGAVHSLTPDGRSVVTRPGGFGGADSLLDIVRALSPHALGRPRPR